MTGWVTFSRSRPGDVVPGARSRRISPALLPPSAANLQRTEPARMSRTSPPLIKWPVDSPERRVRELPCLLHRRTEKRENRRTPRLSSRVWIPKVKMIGPAGRSAEQSSSSAPLICWTCPRPDLRPRPLSGA